MRVAVTADRGDLVAITLYQNRQALDVDGNAWWGWVKFGDPAPGAQPFRMIVEMAAVPTIYGQDQEFVPGRAQAYAVVTVVRPDGSVQYWRMPAEGLQPVTLKAAFPRR